MNILMIEDNEAVSEMLGMFFEKESWRATVYHDGKEGYEAFMNQPDQWDLIVLDLNLPSMDGMQICRQIRQTNAIVPIVMLTARDSESDQVIGLEMGADDYITKPFSPLTMIARIKALKRRIGVMQEQTGKTENTFEIRTEHVLIDTKTHEAFINHVKIEALTPKEFDLLVVLASNARQVFTREHLLAKVWEEPFFGDERTVDAHIKKLRQKIELAGPQVIQTVWGVGYKFDDSELTI